jgi:hypothetical protein
MHVHQTINTCLSLKFCIQEKIPKPQVTKTVARLRRTFRLKAWLDSRPEEDTGKNDDEYIPGMYLPSAWIPPLALPHIENGLNDYFEQHRPDLSDNLTVFSEDL